MLTLAITFPAGRYHATPWGRHVNEAEVAWPPEPWRILRGLVAVWHRKVEAARYPEPLLESLIHRLSAEPPRYRLPPATAAHTRHYMPVREGAREKRVLIFDAFVRVDPQEPLVVSWPGVELPPDEEALLDTLLSGITYLGRAESWAEARRIDEWNEGFNCVPGDGSVDRESGELFDLVDVIVPWEAGAYSAWRTGFLVGEAFRGMRGKKAEALRATVPERLIDAMRLDSADWQGSGWSLPPGAHTINYRRDPDCFVVRPSRAARASGRKPLADTARLILTGKPRPRIEDAVKLGELARMAVTSQAGWLFGKDSVPAVLSGHGMPEGNRHGHAFFLPEDADGDGFVDHLLIHAPAGFCPESRRAIERLRRLFVKGGSTGDGEGLPMREEWQLFLEHMGRADEFAPSGHTSLISAGSRVWRSVTPYLHPWHEKRSFGMEEQIRKECEARPDVGAPSRVEVLPHIEMRGRRCRALDFHRFRSKRGLSQPDRKGTLLELTFEKPVTGPLALGFACHFGLGLFAPVG